MTSLQIHGIKSAPRIYVRPYVKPAELEKIKAKTTQQLMEEVNARQFKTESNSVRLGSNEGCPNFRAPITAHRGSLESPLYTGGSFRQSVWREGFELAAAIALGMFVVFTIFQWLS